MTFSKSVLNEKTRGKERYFLLITEISFLFFHSPITTTTKTKQNKLFCYNLGHLPKSCQITLNW